MVARIVRDDEVGGSNPLAPTKLSNRAPKLEDGRQSGVEAEFDRVRRKLAVVTPVAILPRCRWGRGRSSSLEFGIGVDWPQRPVIAARNRCGSTDGRRLVADEKLGEPRDERPIAEKTMGVFLGDRSPIGVTLNPLSVGPGKPGSGDEWHVPAGPVDDLVAENEVLVERVR